MEDDDLKEKQAYLRENILEKGYDAEEFMTVLQNIKGASGLDLMNWTMSELNDIVMQFIEEKQLQESHPEEEENNENKIIGEDDNNNLPNAPEEAYDLDKFSQDNPNGPPQKEEFGKTSLMNYTPFSEKEDIVVKISSPEKIDGGIFSKSYISYLVETEPFNFKTRRRYSDFLWLRRKLSLIYSQCVIPPLCKKNFIYRFTDELINKRMRSIEKFFRGLLIHPLIKHSQILYDFLSIEKNSEFESKKESYAKIAGPTKVKEIRTVGGEIKISITKEKETYFQNIENNCNTNEDLLRQITKSHKSLLVLMGGVSEKMKEISNLWKSVYEKSVKYYDMPNTSDTYDILSKVMECWSQAEKKQMEILNVNVREYFRYIKNEYHSMGKLAKAVNSNKMIYKKGFDKLYFKKENLFKQQDVDQWGLDPEDSKDKLILLKNKEYAFSKMLPQETKRVMMFKEFYGCFLNSIINEYERIRNINAKRHRETITTFIRQLSDCLTLFHVELADKLAEFSEIKEEGNTNNDDSNNNIENIDNNNQ